jgi:hypothetical protein
VDPRPLGSFEVKSSVVNERDGIVGFGPVLFPIIPWYDKPLADVSYWGEVLEIQMIVRDFKNELRLDLHNATVTLPDGSESRSSSEIKNHCAGSADPDGIYSIPPSSQYCRFNLRFDLRPGDLKQFTFEPGAIQRDGEWVALPTVAFRRYSRLVYWPLVIGDD